MLFALFFLTSCTGKFVKSPVDPNVFHLSSLPDIGEFSGVHENGRFYDEIKHEFIPSDEYGMILPYVGTYRVFETPKEQDWHAEVGYATYGFCTADGRTVLDASDKNTYVYFQETNDGFGYYTLTREVMQKKDAPDEYVPEETYLIPLDGSWCLKLNASSWVSSAGDGRICVCEYPVNGSAEIVRTLVYDYDGNLVSNFDGYDSAITGTNGLLLVSSWTDSSGYAAYFVNEDGKKVLGPFSTASHFNEHGVAAVADEKGAYLINVKGERLTAYYESCFKEFSADSTRHVFTAKHKDNNKCSDVYSDDGKLLGTAEGSAYFSFRFPDNERLIYFYTEIGVNEKGYADYTTERMVWRYLDTGETFVCQEFGVSPNSYSGTDNCFIHTDKTNKKAYIFDAEGKSVAVIDGVSEIISVSEYGEYVVYVDGEYDIVQYPENSDKKLEDTRKTYIYDSEKEKIVYKLDSYSYAYFTDKDKRYILMDVYDEKHLYDILGGDPKYILFDTKNGRAVFENSRSITVYDLSETSYISVCTDNSTALYDENMNVIRKAYFE